MVGSAMVGPGIVMEIMAMETVTIGQEYRTADKQRPIEPRVPPIVRLGVGIQIDGLWRQRVDLLRQSRRIQRDLPAPIWLLARLPDGLSRLPFNRDLRGELAAILKGHLRWDECCVRRARGNRPDTARQDQHHCDTQKGMRTSISRNRGLVVQRQVATHTRGVDVVPFSVPTVRASTAPDGADPERRFSSGGATWTWRRKSFKADADTPPGPSDHRRGRFISGGASRWRRAASTARPPHFTQRGPRSQNPHTRTNAAGSYARGQRRIPAHVSASSRLTNSHNSPSRPPQSEHLSGSECNGVMSPAARAVSSGTSTRRSRARHCTPSGWP